MLYGTKERVSLLVDYGRNQARVEITVVSLTTKSDQSEIYRRELVELIGALSEIVDSPREDCGRLQDTSPDLGARSAWAEPRGS